MTVQSDYDKETERSNFTRAVMLAEQDQLGQDQVDKARDQAFKQAVGQWFNFHGAESLARKWDFDAQRVSKLCDEIIEDFEKRQEESGRMIQVFDIDKMDHTPVIDLIRQFRNKYR